MRERIRQHLPTKSQTLTLVGIIVLLALAGGIIAGYWFGWSGAGVGASTEITDTTKGNETTRTIKQVGAKTLWDWMSLLIVPLVLAIAGYMYNRTEKQRDHERTEDNQREAALQAYLDNMSELLLKENLRNADQNSEVRHVARARTLTGLTRLDSVRKAAVIQILYESQLIFKDNTIVELREANPVETNLRRANLIKVNLIEANLRRANLEGANLIGADLRRANLQRAYLFGANFTEANLEGANFTEAGLEGADLFEADLHGADLHGAFLPSANLTEANLNRTYLIEVNLTNADLTNADLINAELINADLINANLTNTDLTNADLTNATVTNEQLATCEHLNGATLPDGTTVPDDVDNPF